ncbi:hypothetical protein DSCW_32000 [Desulfosarcina widdelii]|uniref:Uncharacterized protein n=1 Tax=Desulfosarcina widdelii TaxID=947919 RepID=A0A5K7Z7E6_9BACT|nr:hypothetical protein [Desulfosarcina widdelii]BBO75783.1 hypothetical protein DSCW_32000 [Desulfosarcina widdelii]
MLVEHPVMKARQKMLSHWLQAIDEGRRDDEEKLLAAKRRLDDEIRRRLVSKVPRINGGIR